ncbi:podocin [Centroberyx gerrardi]
MEKPSLARPARPPRPGGTPGGTPGGEREVSRGQRPARTTESDRRERRRRERPGTKEEEKEVKEEEEEVKVKSTVVDVDNVREREDEEQEESLALLEAEQQDDGVKHRNLGVFEWLLMLFVLILVLLFLPLSIWFCVKVVREQERAVVFRLGHLLRGRPRGPGLLFCLPFLDVCQKVDIRLKMLQVPPHTAVTKDLVRAELSWVCFYRIENVALCGAALCGPAAALQALVQAAARDVLARHDFARILLDRRRVGQQVQAAADSVTCRWGVRLERADIDELSLPAELQQSLSAEAEARRPDPIRVNAAAADGGRAAWEAFRASLPLLQPALLLPLPLTPDLSSLPPPPPPGLEGEGGKEEGQVETDSPMM